MLSINRVIALAVVGAAGCLAGCIPTAARKNAKITPGVEVEVVAGGQWLDEGIDEDNMPTESTGTIYLEADVQWAKLWENQSGFAVQFKVPWSIVYSMLDIYYQLPPIADGLYFGFGGELGGFHGVYAATTYYLGPNVFVSFTPRLLRVAGSESADGTVVRPASLQYSGQFALGFGGDHLDLSMFLMLAHQTGEGFDIQPFGDNNDDFRTNYGLFGVSLRR